MLLKRICEDRGKKSYLVLKFENKSIRLTEKESEDLDIWLNKLEERIRLEERSKIKSEEGREDIIIIK